MVNQKYGRGPLRGASTMMMAFGLLAAVYVTFLQEENIATIRWLLAWLGYVVLLTALVWVVVIRPLRQTETIAAAEAALWVAATELASSRDETAAARKEAQVEMMNAFATWQETASARGEAVAAGKETEATRKEMEAAKAETEAARAEAAAAVARGNITVLTCTREKERVKAMPLRRGSSAPSMPSSDDSEINSGSGMSSADLSLFQQRVSAAAARLRSRMVQEGW